MPPVSVGGDEARRLAERELDKPVYQQHEPSAVEKLLVRLQELIERILTAGDSVSVGGWVGILVVVLLVALVVALVVRRAGVLQRTRKRAKETLLDVAAAVTAADQRTEAERLADSGELAEAIRARMRAIALGLEERALLDPRPGRTADEVSADAAVALPDHADELREAARIFDDVWYGGHRANRESYDRITEIDQTVGKAKPTLAGVTS